MKTHRGTCCLGSIHIPDRPGLLELFRKYEKEGVVDGPQEEEWRAKRREQLTQAGLDRDLLSGHAPKGRQT